MCTDVRVDSGAIVDNEADAVEGEEEDDDWDDEINGDGSMQASQPPVVSCLLPEDVDLFFSSKLADLVRRTADVRNVTRHWLLFVSLFVFLGTHANFLTLNGCLST